jgi:hypothetical protein
VKFVPEVERLAHAVTEAVIVEAGQQPVARVSAPSHSVRLPAPEPGTSTQRPKRDPPANALRIAAARRTLQDVGHARAFILVTSRQLGRTEAGVIEVEASEAPLGFGRANRVFRRPTPFSRHRACERPVDGCSGIWDACAAAAGVCTAGEGQLVRLRVRPTLR